MSVLLFTTFIPNLNQLLPQLISQYGSLIYIGLFALIFIETGIVILPFLPGDSLLFLCGSLAALSGHPLNIWLLIVLLAVAAILGDSLNFEIGEHLGTYLTRNKKLSRFIKSEYLDRSERFFQKHGKGAIFLGRFMPILRTFIPFTAGISQMRYRDFVTYNVLGGITWILIALGAGFFFGNIAIVKAHFELIMTAIIVISLLPAAIMALRKRGGNVSGD
ncbi:VTT domain-containing protein [Sporolactobacillus shoreicorticis]|uniref:VTT domain-containing protein n=1 Tax=Sporolactobacillus shoreicorticis TaxID=1923877 RepID=A0ABW5RZW7_9BACL|nr:VTT domain-containing protein [Sporolactobacillus shoreicorticis]MCO7127505.1 VTT domain-containing protein [Sporolactobacillus shoreicorticis]